MRSLLNLIRYGDLRKARRLAARETLLGELAAFGARAHGYDGEASEPLAGDALDKEVSRLVQLIADAELDPGGADQCTAYVETACRLLPRAAIW